MTDQQTITRKEFPNGDVALDEGNGLVYRTADATYIVELDLPSRPSVSYTHLTLPTNREV